MESPVVTLASSMRSLAMFESPELSRPRPRTLFFSPQSSPSNDFDCHKPTLSTASVAFTCESTNSAAFNESSGIAYEGEVDHSKAWLARSSRLYDDRSCAQSPWRRCDNRCLPIMPSCDKGAAIARLSTDTVARLVNGEFGHLIDEFVIVDCRYDYEHLGGHISGAISVNRREHLHHYFEKLSQKAESMSEKGQRLAIIFHCEFSQHRGPKAYRYFRDLDRQRNVYPHLTFPELYVMDGGYRQFYQSFESLCWPSQYVPMDHPVLSKQWSTETALCRKSWKECSSRASKRSRLPAARSRILPMASPTSSASLAVSRPPVPMFASPC